jgi:hypothetical protein
MSAAKGATIVYVGASRPRPVTGWRRRSDTAGRGQTTSGARLPKEGRASDAADVAKRKQRQKREPPPAADERAPRLRERRDGAQGRPFNSEREADGEAQRLPCSKWPTCATRGTTEDLISRFKKSRDNERRQKEGQKIESKKRAQSEPRQC